MASGRIEQILVATHTRGASSISYEDPRSGRYVKEEHANARSPGAIVEPSGPSTRVPPCSSNKTLLVPSQPTGFLERNCAGLWRGSDITAPRKLWCHQDPA